MLWRKQRKAIIEWINNGKDDSGEKITSDSLVRYSFDKYNQILYAKWEEV